MKRNNFTRLGLLTTVASLALVPVSAAALQATTAASTTSGNSARLQLIISRGNTEITRRLTALGKLSSKISSATYLSSGDQATLSGDVSSEVANLTALKTKLDADTDVNTAVTDAQSIITDYRVYALVVPQVYLVKTADDQQTVESKLTGLYTKLSGLVSSSSSTAIQNDLKDMNTQITNAQAISSSIETKVVDLQPSDYDSDHTLLSGDRDQLKTAQGDIQAATTDAKTIIASLKS
jgi:hypothetical protein